MTNARRIAELVREQLPHIKRGSLRFWGQWFGRPYDNIYTITSIAVMPNDELELGFDAGETLRISKPRGAMLSDSEFSIREANALRWEWNKYDSLPVRRFFQEYARRGSSIDATTDIDWYVADLRPSPNAPALEIV